MRSDRFKLIYIYVQIQFKTVTLTELSFLRYLSKMNNNVALVNLRADFIQSSIIFKELIKEIRDHGGNQADLDGISKLVRSKINQIKELIDELSKIHLECDNPEEKLKLSDEVLTWKRQLQDSHAQFRNSLLAAQLSIHQVNKEELFATLDSSASTSDSSIRLREKMSRDLMIKKSHELTDDLLTVTRMIQDNTEKSTKTLDKLVETSHTVTNTQEEIKTMGSVIGQAKKILNKYGRRENTDKLLILLGLIFFIASCLVVLRNRLFYNYV